MTNAIQDLKDEIENFENLENKIDIKTKLVSNLKTSRNVLESNIRSDQFKHKLMNQV